MKNILLNVLMLLILAASITSRAQAGDAKGFVGLWERVEPTDGSHDLLSITGNGDGTFKVLQYATYFTVCNGGRGIGQGTGKVSAEGTLTVDDFTGTCFETGNTVKESDTFSINSDGTLTGEDRNDPSAPKSIYHRTSK